MSRLIRVAENLLEFMGTRTEDGRKLSYEWGEPVETVMPGTNAPVVADPDKLDWLGTPLSEPVYEPTITATDDGKVMVDAALAAERDRLREAAEAALTDFVYAQGSDFDAAEFPGMAALRAALVPGTPVDVE